MIEIKILTVACVILLAICVILGYLVFSGNEELRREKRANASLMEQSYHYQKQIQNAVEDIYRFIEECKSRENNFM